MKIMTTIFALFLFQISFAQDCNIPYPPGLDCADAPVLCVLDGYCSTTVNSNPGIAPPSFCGQVENAHWLKFIAGSNTLSLEVTPSNCNLGLQGQIYATDDCNNFMEVSNCFDQNNLAIFTLNAENLIIGQTYTILIDGKGGDVCDYELAVLDGDVQTPEMAEAGEPVFLCPDEVVFLNGVGSEAGNNIVYQWLTSDGNIVSGENTLTPGIDSPGTYFLEVRDTLADCEHVDFVIIELSNPPIASIAEPEILNCITNMSVTLDATNSTTFPSVDIQWRDVNGTILPSTDLTLEVVNGGTYFLFLNDLDTGCSAVDSVNVIADLNTPVANAGENAELNCLASQIQINGMQSSTGNDFVYNWETDTGSFLSGQSTLTPVVDAAGTYILTVSNTENGCEAVDEVVINLNEEVPQGADITLKNPCFGETTGSIVINNVTGGNPPYAYSIDDEFYSVNPRFQSVGIGRYTLTVRDAIGCEWSTEIDISELDELVLDLGSEREIFLGDSFQIDALTNLNETEFALISWSPDSTLSCSDCLEPWARPLESEVYNLELIDENGCRTTSQLAVYVDETPRVYFPNVFSPNNDGSNDFFYLFAGQEIEKIVEFQVFNRWGSLLFEQKNSLPNDAELGWNGTFNGQLSETGVYVYAAKVLLIDGRVESFFGDVLLVR